MKHYYSVMAVEEHVSSTEQYLYASLFLTSVYIGHAHIYIYIYPVVDREPLLSIIINVMSTYHDVNVYVSNNVWTMVNHRSILHVIA